MAKANSLYPLLKAYTAKISSPYIDINVFLDFLQKYAQHKAQEAPEWEKWLSNTEVQFWSELSALAESRKCILLDDKSDRHLYMPFFYEDKINAAYRDLDSAADIPFPSENTLNYIIPDVQLQIINLKADMHLFFNDVKKEDSENPADSWGPNQIIRMIFPDDLGSALLLASMLPRKIMEAAILKVRHYLRNRGNKDFVRHKLSPMLQGNEKYLNETLDQIMIRPYDCLKTMEKSEDFSYLFWTYFCNMIKADIGKRNDTLSEDIAVFQSAYILEICNGYYKAAGTKRRKRETAFRNLESNMGKPPCYFTREEILKFSTEKGIPLLGMYSMQELDKYIKQMITSAENNELPAWFILKGEKQWYIRKDKYLSLCVKMLLSSQPAIKNAVTKRWIKILRSFRKEPAMEKDSDFEKLLSIYTSELSSPLAIMLNDQRLLWVYEETERLQGTIPASLRIFKSGALFPLSKLYMLRRKELLADAKMLLPFWYTMPLLAPIMAFFMKLFKRKTVKQTYESGADENNAGGKSSVLKEIQDIAAAMETQLIPDGKSLEICLEELEEKWNRLLNPKSRHNLILDIQSLVRDYLRKMLRVHKTKKISADSIKETASLIISRTHALHKINDQDALYRYIQLYFVKKLLAVNPDQLSSKIK